MATATVHVIGSRPAHIHTCPDGHTWECNSPYCPDTNCACPEHGGPDPVIQGYEPWRGR